MTWDPPDDLDQSLAELGPAAAGAFEDAVHQGQLRDQLVALRKRSRLSQQKIAELMETTQSAVSELESGRVEPRVSTLQRYVRALGAKLELRLVDPVTAEPVHTPESELVAEVLPTVVDESLGAVLKVLVRDKRVHGARSADHLVKTTGLPRSAVGTSVDRLSAQGWVRLIGSPAQPSRVVALNPDRALVVGVSLRERHAHGTITDLLADEQFAVSEREFRSQEPKAVVADVAALVAELIAASDRKAEVLGLGVEIAGVVQNDWGRVSFARDFDPLDHRWRTFELQTELQAATGLRTVVENDTNALAVHEYLRRGEAADLAVVLFSENGGIGCGLIHNGNLLHGAAGISGEIGHVVVAPGGDPCLHSGQRGCLETVAGIRTIDHLVAHSPMQSSVDIHRAAGDQLGEVLTTVNSVLAEPLFVVYGPARLTDEQTEPARVFGDAVKDRLHRGWFTQFGVKPNVELRELTETAGARGAASVAVSHFLQRPLRWLAAARAAAQASARTPLLPSM